MLFRNPRLSAIVKKVSEMCLDSLADHLELYDQEDQAIDIILQNLKKKRGGEPMHIVSELIQYIPVRKVLTLKITTEESIKEIRKLLITLLKERKE